MKLTSKINHNSIIPPWPDILPKQLAEIGSGQLLKEKNLKRENYSTASFITDSQSRPELGDSFLITTRRSDPEILIEILSDPMIDSFGEIGLRFAPIDLIRCNDMVESVSTALQKYLDYLPGLHASVSDLVWVIHLLEVDDEDYDVSYSSPHIPFSIFVSAPKRVTTSGVLRVAESIVHETMHLQLSLLEQVIPLVDSKRSQECFFSPWKGEFRDARGILHGLYVFGVLREFWNNVAGKDEDLNTVEFAKSRISEISQQIQQISKFSASPALTAEGRDVVKAIVEQSGQPTCQLAPL